jgi:hypothetical protein
MREVTYREDLLCRETKRLMALGVVQELRLEATTQPVRGLLHPHPRPGRKRVYQSDAKRQRAYRYRSKSRTVTK